MIAIANTNCEVCGATTDWTPELAVDIRKLGGKVECAPCRRKAMKPWPILFWGTGIDSTEDIKRDPGAAFVGLFTALVGLPGIQPKNCVRKNISQADRDELAKALVAGSTIESYFGYANCRICGLELGCKDLGGWGFMWPDKAEHYILVHDVWTPGCSRLLAAVRST